MSSDLQECRFGVRWSLVLTMAKARRLHNCEVGFCRVRTNHTSWGIYPGYLQRTSVSSVGHSYPYPELLEVLYDIHTRNRKFWKFCTPVPQIPGVRVYHFHNICEFIATIPGTSVSSVSLPYRTRNFCKFCKIPIP